MGAEATRSELYCPTCEGAFASGERCPADNTRLVRIAGAAQDKLIGRELDGRYTILEKLGQGGMGAVYRATQHSVGRDVAIKVVKPSLITEGMVIKRFLREAKLASRLSHPNAIGVLDFGQTDDGLFYLVMELVVGRTLEQVLETDGVLPPQRLVRIGVQICDALEGAHDLQIIHRDLKPQNVMVMGKGRDHIKVLDFGIAKSLTPEPGATTMTNAGAILGTPAFMPPELVTDNAADQRADLYSLGCVLYLCATGQLPFTAGTAHEVMVLHATERPATATGIPPALAAVIDRLLEKEPEKRYQTAAATRDALEAALAGVPQESMRMSAAKSKPTMLGWRDSSPSMPKVTPTPVPRAVTPRPVDDDVVKTLVATPSRPLTPMPAPTQELPEPPRSHRLAWILGGSGVVIAGVAAIIAFAGGGGTTKPAAGVQETAKREATIAPTPDPVVKPEVKADAKAEAKVDVKPAVKADAKAEASSETKPDVKPAAKVDARSVATVDAKPAAKAAEKPVVKKLAPPPKRTPPPAPPKRVILKNPGVL